MHVLLLQSIYKKQENIKTKRTNFVLMITNKERLCKKLNFKLNPEGTCNKFGKIFKIKNKNDCWSKTKIKWKFVI